MRLALLLLLVSTQAFATQPPPSISVSGTASISVAPDLADIRVSIQTEAETLDEAIAQNDTRIKAVLQVIRGHGIAAVDLRTAHLHLGERREHGARVGHTAQRDVQITLRDLSRLEALMQSMLKAGVTRIQQMELGTSKAISIKNDARIQAIKAAREKARSLAGALDQSIGKAISITENQANGGGGRIYNNFAVQSAGAGASGTTVATGQVTIRMTLYATFLLN